MLERRLRPASRPPQTSLSCLGIRLGENQLGERSGLLALKGKSKDTAGCDLDYSTDAQSVDQVVQVASRVFDLPFKAAKPLRSPS